MVKPIALRVMGLDEGQVRPYLDEVEMRLLEETDYELELRRGRDIAARCAHLPHLEFPRYYPELSSARVLTMDWLGGQHLAEFMATNPSQEVRNQVGQALWDFYQFQLHTLHQVHADPHPGNFLFRAENGGTLGVLDFGCVKEIPADFQQQFLTLLSPDLLQDESRFVALLTELEMLRPSDDAAKRQLVLDVARPLLTLVARPFQQPTFDFGDPSYLAELYALGDSMMQDPQLRQEREPRGSRHFIYVNRTYFGLYSLLSELRAVVHTAAPTGQPSA
jgi:predicted unusual protein kinase regulating ubiquinone biosynthesis (AarF/ABC1/UbiB family)